MSDPFFPKITAGCQTHSPGPILRRRGLATPILSRAKHIFSSLCSLCTFVLHSHIVKLGTFQRKSETVILLTSLVALNRYRSTF